jgi:hypothetical protein
MPMIEEASALLVQSQLQKAVMDSYQQSASALYVLEARYTLFHVHRLLQNKNNPWLEKTLENFLKTRWERLKNTDAQYFHDIHNPANLMCIEIAKTLGRLQNKPYLPFLIPALGMVPAFAYVASSYDDDNLAFNQLMLSDDGTRMIHIPDVLEFAEQDGALKHSSLFNDKRRDLNIAEENRLLARHPSVENYYHAIRDKINFQLHGETAGAYLARLISGLREGGSLGSGEEFIAGEEANIAIADFSIFLESLSEETKRNVLNAGKVDRWRNGEVKHRTIGHLWELLVNPSKREEDDKQEVRYCVELIADDLENILGESPTLYQLMPFEQEGVGTLASFEEAITQCKTTMLGALNTSKAHRYYGVAGDDKFALDVLSKVSRDRAFYLDYADIAYVARCYRRDNPDLRAPSESILLHTRDYMTSKSLRKALKGLPRQVAHDVTERVFPRPNRHLFYPAEPQQHQEEEEKPSEHLNKKSKHVHFNV